MATNDVKSLTFCEAATAPRVRNGSERLSLDGWTEGKVEEEGEKECKECGCGRRREGSRHCEWWIVVGKWSKKSGREMHSGLAQCHKRLTAVWLISLYPVGR